MILLLESFLDVVEAHVAGVFPDTEARQQKPSSRQRLSGPLRSNSAIVIDISMTAVYSLTANRGELVASLLTTTCNIFARRRKVFFRSQPVLIGKVLQRLHMLLADSIIIGALTRKHLLE